MIVKKQKPIQFQSPDEVIFDRSELAKAILWYSDKPVTQFKCIFLWGKYYAVSIYEEKIHIHRLLMMYWLKSDLDRYEYVHHKDGNKFNNSKENLEIMWASTHQSLTKKGIPLSIEHRKNIGIANKKRKGMKFKKK